jgi:hypothetical protein
MFDQNKLDEINFFLLKAASQASRSTVVVENKAQMLCPCFILAVIG